MINQNVKDQNFNKNNHLIGEKSPYLLEHAHNLVDWYPWSEEAFEKARLEDKPIFLSIGYSTCHWCHVFQKESFNDAEVAKILNENFISIKVDREERPDLDKTYMLICQLLTGSGGWPLSIFMTHDKKPFFAGTYFPKESRFGRVGFKDLLINIVDLWGHKKNEIINSSNKIITAVKQISLKSIGPSLDKNILEKSLELLKSSYDGINGGFGRAPKFPVPQNLLFLLRMWNRTKNPFILEIISTTLKKMRMGGIYDQVGFGFHRYSVDSEWLVPHFEKMLYDQALLAMVYLETFQVIKNEEFATTAIEILEYLIRDMRDENGGFYSAEDADSEGEEGKFYMWTTKELKDVLTTEEYEIVEKVFNVKVEGNFLEEATKMQIGKNILHMIKDFDALSDELKMSRKSLEEKINAIRKKLFNIREKRVKPHKDMKILTDWNGLVIAALAKAGNILGEDEYVEIAKKTANFFIKEMRTPDGKLMHSYFKGHKSSQVYLDDHAFFTWGLLNLYEATLELKFLINAIELINDQIDLFWDEDNGGFFFTPKGAEKLILRQKESYDGAIPSGNSVSLLNLIRVSMLIGDNDLKEKAHLLIQNFSEEILNAPTAHVFFLLALDKLLGPSYVVVIRFGDDKEKAAELIKSLRSKFLPHMELTRSFEEGNALEVEKLKKYPISNWINNGDAMAFICSEKECLAPTNDLKKIFTIIAPEWKNKSEVKQS
ncbi:MAG: thioredoxin domain-containing protein [Promethearchaeota archaeon]